MRIVLDARLYGLENTGIGRYVMELTHWLLKLDQTNYYTVLIRSEHRDDLPTQANLKTHVLDIRHYTLKEQLELPKLLHQLKPDLIHIPHFNAPLFLRTPFIVTIHDLLWHEVVGYNVTTLNPLLYTLKYFGYRAVVKHALTQSQKIITPSQWVKSQILTRFPHIHAEKIAVTYEGIDHSFTQKPQATDATALTRSFSIAKPFLVYTGSLYPHKNITVLLKALHRINAKSNLKISLVLISARSVFTHKVRQLAYNLDLENYVHLVGFLSDKELVHLYHEALALVHPSTSEGFGLTGLEAMATRLPVIASHAASLPEVYEEAALYFNPQSDTDLAEKILLLMRDTKLRQTLIKAGQKKIKDYSWRKMAQETLKVYEEVGKKQQ